MTPQKDDNANVSLTQEIFQEMLQEKLRNAIRLTMATVLDQEIEAYLHAGRYERTPNRQDRRNGYLPALMKESAFGIVCFIALHRVKFQAAPTLGRPDR